MRCRLVTLLIAVMLIATPIFGCGTTESTSEEVDRSASTISTETQNNIPEGYEIDVDENGRKRWKHGNHYHYLDDEEDQKPPELVDSSIISEYCLENDIPSECVSEKLNVDSTYLDMSIQDLAVLLGFETFDIKMIIKNCR